jgi:hypothetical protein
VVVTTFAARSRAAIRKADLAEQSKAATAEVAHRDGYASSAPLYDAVRAHEVMLNQATSAFEHAVITRLTLLNGGAATAFLTLLGAISAKDSQLRVNSFWAGTAVLAWIVGLIAAAGATSYGLGIQQATNLGYRLMRQQLERKLFEPDIADIVKAPDEDTADPAAKRIALRKECGRLACSLTNALRVSIVFFVVGVGLAAIAVL